MSVCVCMRIMAVSPIMETQRACCKGCRRPSRGPPEAVAAALSPKVVQDFYDLQWCCIVDAHMLLTHRIMIMQSEEVGVVANFAATITDNASESSHPTT
jgi:hypothetical protein